MTNKQQATIKMSMIPLAIILIIIIGAGYLLLKGEFKINIWNRGLQLRRLENFPVTIYTDKTIEKQRLVLKTGDELNQFLNLVDSSGLTVVKENINFDKEMLIAVSTATNPENGHKLRIKKVSQNKEDKELLVTSIESEMGDNCTVERDKNIIVDLVAISKSDWNVRFDRLKNTEVCKEETTPSQE